MKFLNTLFVMAALLFTPVHASDFKVLSSENEVGGMIVLTSIECPVDTMSAAHIAFTTAPNVIIYGCWIRYENEILVLWITPDKIIPAKYSPSIFKLEKIA